MRAISRIAAIGLAISLAAAVVLLAEPAAAKAYTTPPTGHESFANNSSICVLCHRTHTATGLNLLRSGAGLCLSCHKKGVGADTDVTSGIYNLAGSVRHGVNGWGALGAPLLAGGFSSIDTNGDGIAETTSYGTYGTDDPATDPLLLRPGTSQHAIGVAQVPFGSTAGASITLDCTSCHTIHKSFDNRTQYRFLREDVGSHSGLKVTWNGPWTDSTQTTHQDDGYRAYTERDFNYVPPPPDDEDIQDEDIQEYTRNYQSGMSAWCSGCHSVYMTEVGPYDIGDGQGSMIRHKHKIDMTLTNTGDLGGLPATDLPLNDLTGNSRTNDDTMSCVTCHRAHGTDTKSTTVGAYQVAGRGSLPTMNTSMLLRLDNRGVCINCHGYLND